MAEDPYKTLSVGRDASADDIRKAFRTLAKKHHPDLNPGDKSAEARFKAINAANDILSDPEKRGKFDRGEIDAAGDPTAPEPPRYRSYADAASGGFGGAGFGGAGFRGASPEDIEGFSDIFGDFLRRSGAAGGEQVRLRGQDAQYALAVEFLDTVNGATRTLTLPDGKTLDVKIPPGIEDGQVLRLRGQGGPGFNGGPPGDALIEIRTYPHPFFTRDGDDIHVEVPVTLKEAVLGGRITVPTPTGSVAMTVPKRSDSGAKLRLRGRGIPAHAGRPAGDEYVTLRVTLADADDALERFLEGWTPAKPTHPRSSMEGA